MALEKETFAATNTQGTIHMLDATLRVKPATFQRFLYVSSQAAAGPAVRTPPITEADPRRPIAWYGSSKSESEEVIKGYAGGLAVTIVRPSSVSGARRHDLSQKFPLVNSRLH